jgi:hypothetical protein
MRLTREPSPQWAGLALERTELTQAHMLSLLRLPALTALCPTAMPVSADGMEQLSAVNFPHLTRLHVICGYDSAWSSAFMASLMDGLPQLRELTLQHVTMSGDELARVLQPLQHLSKLKLLRMGGTEHLRGVAQLTELCELYLDACHHPQLHPEQLTHLHALTKLHKLRLKHTFSSPLSVVQRMQYEPLSRTLLIPSLRNFWLIERKHHGAVRFAPALH